MLVYITSVCSSRIFKGNNAKDQRAKSKNFMIEVWFFLFAISFSGLCAIEEAWSLHEKHSVLFVSVGRPKDFSCSLATHT